VSKDRLSEAAFNATLAARVGALAAPTSGLHMNDVPSGPSKKSLEELLAGANESPSRIAASAPVGLPEPSPIQGKTVVKVPVQNVVDSPYQPRDRYDESEIQALGEALKARGQDEPIIVRQLPTGKFELISGHRRLRAARLIGWQEIDAQIRSYDDRSAHLATLVSNESHVKLSDYERGKAYRAAITNEFATDQKGVAQLFGCSQGRVSQCMSLFKLPEPILTFMDKYPGLVAYRHYRIIKEVLDAYPGHTDTIATSLEILIDHPNMDLEKLRTGIMKGLQKKRVRPTPAEPRTISDKNGVSAFKVRVNDKQIVINIEDGVDIELASKRAMAALRDYANDLELPTKEKYLKSKT